MTMMSFDLEDGKPPVSFTLKPADVARFVEFMAECSRAITRKPTVTLTGYQLRAALEIINPDGITDEEQLSDELTIGIRKHEDDDGKVETGMCCWNGDTDGVFPLAEGSAA